VSRDTNVYTCRKHNIEGLTSFRGLNRMPKIDLSLVPAGAQYEVRRGVGPTNRGYIIVDTTWRDKMVGPYSTKAEAKKVCAVMQAEADGRCDPGAQTSEVTPETASSDKLAEIKQRYRDDPNMYWVSEVDWLLGEVERLRAALELADEVARLLADEGSWHEEIAEEDSCEAGNFDGGTSRNCPHCHHQQRGQAIDALLTRWDTVNKALHGPLIESSAETNRG
jgi:hypothetical protein